MPEDSVLIAGALGDLSHTCWFLYKCWITKQRHQEDSKILHSESGQNEEGGMLETEMPPWSTREHDQKNLSPDPGGTPVLASWQNEEWQENKAERSHQVVGTLGGWQYTRTQHNPCETLQRINVPAGLEGSDRSGGGLTGSAGWGALWN